MDVVVIEDSDDGTVERLHARALQNGREVNDEVLEILRVAVAAESLHRSEVDPSQGKIESTTDSPPQKIYISFDVAGVPADGLLRRGSKSSDGWRGRRRW